MTKKEKMLEIDRIEERLSKFKEIGVDGLVSLFNNLTDEDLERVVQMSFKEIRKSTPWEILNPWFEKMGELEKIEEDLGIDLITLFRALRCGIFCRYPLGETYMYTSLTNDRLSIEYKWKCLRKGSQKFYFKDYGKTWAITMEEFE